MSRRKIQLIKERDDKKVLQYFKLSNELLEKIKARAKDQKRSVPQQIEYEIEGNFNEQ